MNLNDIYNYFLSQGMSPAAAAQATAWQAITNPSGSLSQLRAPERWYSNQEIYDYYAPNFSAALNFPVQRDAQGNLAFDQGGKPLTDPLAAYTSENINNILKTKNKITFGDISNIASRAPKELNSPKYGGVSLATQYGISPQDYYNQLKDIVNEYNTAQKQIETQSKTHPFAQRGLPNPNLRYGLADDPTRDLVAYKPAVDYITKKRAEQEQKFRKAGLTGTQLDDSLKKYTTEISKSVQAKIDASGVTPFLDRAKQLASVKKGK